MEVTGFPTSCDIYLELEGKKVAVVQSYTAKATKTSQVVEAFGESEPVATINGQNKYVLELTRLYATDDAISDGIDFFSFRRRARWAPWWRRRSPSWPPAASRWRPDGGAGAASADL